MIEVTVTYEDGRWCGEWAAPDGWDATLYDDGLDGLVAVIREHLIPTGLDPAILPAALSGPPALP